MANKPSYELIVAANRLAAGEVEALPEIWALLFTKMGDPAFDPKRPAEDSVNDVTKRLAELYPPAEPEPTAPAEDFFQKYEDFFRSLAESTKKYDEIGKRFAESFGPLFQAMQSLAEAEKKTRRPFQ